MHAVRAQRHVLGRLGRRPTQRRLKCHGPALDAGVVTVLHVPPRHAGVAAHGAAIFLGCLVILQHRLDDERGQIALFRVGASPQAAEIIVGDLDGGLGHQCLGSLLDGGNRDHSASLARGAPLPMRHASASLCRIYLSSQTSARFCPTKWLGVIFQPFTSEVCATMRLYQSTGTL
jgi:hypothetical protein